MLVSVFILYYIILGFGTDLLLLNNDPLGLVGPTNAGIPYATIISFLFAGVYATYCFYDGDRLILRSVNADTASESDPVDGTVKWIWIVVILVPVACIGLIIYSLVQTELLLPKIGGLRGIRHALGYTPYVVFIAVLLVLVAFALGHFRERYEDLADVSGGQILRRILHNDPAHRQLINVVNEMSIASGIPMPSIYLVRDADPNAFATGRDPRHASIAVTTGLLEKLDREELQAVVAHAMAHIRNNDIRLMTLLVTLGTGSILLASSAGAFLGRGVGKATIARFILLVPGMVVFLPLWIGLIMFTSLTVRALQLLISDERVYQADVTAAQLTRNPEGLIRALKNIDFYIGPTRSFRPAIGALCVVGPAGEYQRMDNAGFTFRFCMKAHPPMRERIEALKSLGFLQGARAVQE
jgi:heat shock protein HtpX